MWFIRVFTLLFLHFLITEQNSQKQFDGSIGDAMDGDDLSEISNSPVFSDTSDAFEPLEGSPLNDISEAPECSECMQPNHPNMQNNGENCMYDIGLDETIDDGLFPDAPIKFELMEKTEDPELKDPRLEINELRPKNLLEVDLDGIPTARMTYVDKKLNRSINSDTSPKRNAVRELVQKQKLCLRRIYTRTQIKNHRRRKQFKRLRELLVPHAKSPRN